MSRRFSRSELVGAELVWLLSIEWAGRTFRWSSRPCDPIDSDGDPVPHDGGLPAIQFSESFSLLSLTPDTRSVALELDFPVDVAALIQLGHDLASATGELSLWRVGSKYADRMVLLAGRVVEPEYGAEGEPVSLSIEQAPWDDRALVPEASHRVTVDTFPYHHADARGLYYPIPFGLPGHYTDSNGNSNHTTSGSPALVVTWDDDNSWADELLIADGECAASTGGSVLIYSADGQSYVSSEPYTSTDAFGRTVTLVSLLPEDTAFRADTSYWVGWNDDGMAILKDDRSGGVAGAGDLLIWMLRRASVPVDLPRFDAVKAYLNRWKVSGYVDDAVSPVEWLTDNLLPLIPVSLAYGADGVIPVVWRLDAGAADAVEAITAGPGVVRTGLVSYTRGPSDVVNDVRVSFAARARTGDFLRTVSCRPDPDEDSKDEFTSYYARISAARYGAQAESVETDIVYDEATAGLIAEWLVRAKALPIRTVTYETGIEFGWLEPGDVVTLTDEELSFSSQVCLVETVSWTSEVSVELTLLIVDDPARDR